MKRILITFLVGLLAGLVLGTMLGHKLQPTEDQVVEFISHMSFPELAAFNKRLSSQAGLQVFQTQILPTAPAAGPSVPAAPGGPAK
jgi:hypothetical protein